MERVCMKMGANGFAFWLLASRSWLLMSALLVGFEGFAWAYFSGAEGGLLEDKLVASGGCAVGMEATKRKTACAIKIEDLFGRGNFKGITTDPVDDVLP